jgi:hypothetical protein
MTLGAANAATALTNIGFAWLFLLTADEKTGFRLNVIVR